MNEPKRQHYIPKMLLKRFTDSKGLLFVYNRNESKKGVQNLTPKNTFAINHYYTSKTNDGDKDFSLENSYSRLESDANQIIEKIVTAVRLGENPNLLDREKNVWDNFLYAQWQRTPDMTQKWGIDETFNDVVSEVITKIESVRPLNPNEHNLLKDKKSLERIKNNARIIALKRKSLKIMKALGEKGLGIAVIKSPRKSFIIGSLPVVKLTNGTKTHLSDPTVEVWLPIAQDVAITPYFERNIEKVVQIPDQHIRDLNVMIARQSSIIAGRSKELIKSLISPR